MKAQFIPLTLCLGLAALVPAGWSQTDPSPGPAAPVSSSGAPMLKFNFRGAPLDSVLHYVGDAAGYIVVMDTPVTGTVDMWSTSPVSKADALQLLNVLLDKNGYAAQLQGKVLMVSSKDEAKKRNIPIHTGNNPDDIPLTADLVMQVIPLRRIDATQAAKDLATLIPSSASLSTNQDSNSLVVTDTEMNIHHIVELVAALDTTMDEVSATQIFHLKHADPVEMATLLTSLYNGTGTPGAAGGQRPGGGLFGGGFGGFGGGLGGGLGGFRAGGIGGAAGPVGGGGGGGGGANRTASGVRTIPVVAVADPRTYSVVVSASKDQLRDIAQIISHLDSSGARQQKAYTITMQNADVQQVQAVLQNLFQSSTNRTTTNTQADALNTRATTNAQQTNTAPTINLGGTSTGSVP